MEGCAPISPLKSLRLRRAACAGSAWLARHADPLRGLIQGRALRSGEALPPSEPISAAGDPRGPAPVETRESGEPKPDRPIRMETTPLLTRS